MLDRLKRPEIQRFDWFKRLKISRVRIQPLIELVVVVAVHSSSGLDASTLSDFDVGPAQTS